MIDRRNVNVAVVLFIGIAFASVTGVAKAQDNKPEKVPIATVTAWWTYLWTDQGAGERIGHR